MTTVDNAIRRDEQDMLDVYEFQRKHPIQSEIIASIQPHALHNAGLHIFISMASPTAPQAMLAYLRTHWATIAHLIHRDLPHATHWDRDLERRLYAAHFKCRANMPVPTLAAPDLSPDIPPVGFIAAKLHLQNTGAAMHLQITANRPSAPMQLFAMLDQHWAGATAAFHNAFPPATHQDQEEPTCHVTDVKVQVRTSSATSLRR